MVEHRRHLNSQLRQRKSDPYMSKSLCGKRVRHPKCARCGVHGQSIPLRGHKKTNCAYSTCTCDKCNLVEMRRTLMAKQVKLRREQQKKRKAMREQRPQFECELQGQQCAVANDGKTAIFAASSLLVGPVNNTVLNDMARPVPRNFVGFERPAIRFVPAQVAVQRNRAVNDASKNGSLCLSKISRSALNTAQIQQTALHSVTGRLGCVSASAPTTSDSLLGFLRLTLSVSPA